MRSALETIIGRDILPLLEKLRVELLSPTTSISTVQLVEVLLTPLVRGCRPYRASLCAHQGLVMSLQPETEGLIRSCAIPFKIPKPKAQPEDDAAKRLRATLLFHLKETETALEYTKTIVLLRTDGAMLKEIGLHVQQLKKLLVTGSAVVFF